MTHEETVERLEYAQLLVKLADAQLLEALALHFAFNPPKPDVQEAQFSRYQGV